MNKADILRLPPGTEVVFNQTLLRVSAPIRLNPYFLNKEGLTYKPISTATKVGVFIGYRFLQEGFVDYSEDSEDSREWVQTGSILCALIVTSPRKNPIRVPIEAVERLVE
jgi:hypothetical protein